MPYGTSGDESIVTSPPPPKREGRDAILETIANEAMKKGPVTKWPKGMPNPVMESVRGTNAAVGMPPNVYHVPKARALGVGGWTMPETGNMFIANDSAMPLSNVVAHEGLHSMHSPAGMPFNPSTEGKLDKVIAANMEKIYPDATWGEGPTTPPWGLTRGANPEERMAGLRGYEGGLPVNVPITKSPVAQQLFNAPWHGPLSVNDTDLQNYYYQKTSNPKIGGVWGTQAPEPTIGERAMSLGRNLATRLGINMVNRNAPAMPGVAEAAAAQDAAQKSSLMGRLVSAGMNPSSLSNVSDLVKPGLFEDLIPAPLSGIVDTIKKGISR
jgi:hypothetical protein